MAFEKEIITAIISLVVAVVGAILAYLFTKIRERQAELRQAKMKRYDDLVGCLTKLVQNSTNNNKKEVMEAGSEFIDAYYRAGVYASKDVLDACVSLFMKLKDSKPLPLKSVKDIETPVDSIYNAIRRDALGLKPKEPDQPFRAYHLREEDGVFYYNP